MDKVLSIIIPTYNMSEFLGRCLDSLTPIKNIDRLDVIIVNDGSVDNSLEIANRYVTSFPESFRVIDKSNGNYGSCINAGLEQATGKYVKVLDADDFYDTPSLESFIATMADIDADLIVTDFVRVYSPSKTKETVLHYSSILATDRRKAFRTPTWNGPSCRCVPYRRSTTWICRSIITSWEEKDRPYRPQSCERNTETTSNVHAA